MLTYCFVAVLWARGRGSVGRRGSENHRQACGCNSVYRTWRRSEWSQPWRVCSQTRQSRYDNICRLCARVLCKTSASLLNPGTDEPFISRLVWVLSSQTNRILRILVVLWSSFLTSVRSLRPKNLAVQNKSQYKLNMNISSLQQECKDKQTSESKLMPSLQGWNVQ